MHAHAHRSINYSLSPLALCLCAWLHMHVWLCVCTHGNWLRTDCVDVRLCNLTVHTGLSADSILGTFGGSKVTVVCATAWLSVEMSTVDITAKSHLQSKSSLEEEFWDAASEIYTDIAKKRLSTWLEGHCQANRFLVKVPISFFQGHWTINRRPFR